MQEREREWEGKGEQRQKLCYERRDDGWIDDGKELAVGSSFVSRLGIIQMDTQFRRHLVDRSQSHGLFNHFLY